jgi:hypothetical protein
MGMAYIKSTAFPFAADFTQIGHHYTSFNTEVGSIKLNSKIILTQDNRKKQGIGLFMQNIYIILLWLRRVLRVLPKG